MVDTHREEAETDPKVLHLPHSTTPRAANRTSLPALRTVPLSSPPQISSYYGSSSPLRDLVTLESGSSSYQSTLLTSVTYHSATSYNQALIPSDFDCDTDFSDSTVVGQPGAQYTRTKRINNPKYNSAEHQRPPPAPRLSHRTQSARFPATTPSLTALVHGTSPMPVSPPAPTSRVRRRSSTLSAHASASTSTPGTGPSSKRQRTSKHTPPSFSTAKSIEQIDLSQESDNDAAALQSTLAKQRADAVASQSGLAPEPSPNSKSKLNTLQCTVCLDTPTDLTATSCGHTFCYACLMDWLVAAEREGAVGGARRSNCPACRKPLSRAKKGDVIPLQIKLTRRPR